MFWNHVIGIISVTVTILLSQTSAECPADKPVAVCAKAPCDVTSCACFTDAVCRNDYCGGCNAKFYIGKTEVTKNCDLCVKDKLRLLGNSGRHGVVELILNGGSWKKLCSAWKFNDNDAEITCKELGFNKGYALPLAAYGPIGGLYSVPLIGCNSGVGSILDCNFDKNSTLCSHQNVFYGSVVCLNETNQPVVTDLLDNDSKSNETYYGRVRLYRRSVWGQVCSTYWSDLDAAVFCRQMNFLGGYALKYNAESDIPFVKTGVNCNGTESDIENCQSQTQICYDGYAAGAVCYKTTGLQLNLEDGGKTYGRVDVTLDGKKGTICNVDWTDEDADVACRQLGFKSGVKYYGSVPSGTGDVFLSNLKCTIYEDTLFMCASSGWKNITDSKCMDHSNDAGVYCYDNVRLSGGRTNNNISMGRIEVYQKIHTTGVGYWSTLCADDFDQADADVVCRQLRYHRAKILSPGIFGRLVYNSYTAEINCTGKEDQVLDCPHVRTSTCRHYDYASVICMMDAVSDDFKIYLANQDSGTVSVEQYGVYGTVCLDGWDDNDANVVCRSLGFNGGKSFGTRQSYTRSDPIWLTDVDCKGTESRIQDCNVNFDVSLDCGKSFSSAGAICYQSSGFSTRLVGGTSDNRGRLEVSRDGVWGTVCDNSWSPYDARVACKELGFPDGISYTRSHYGRGTGPIHLDGLQCYGTEKSIFECPNNGWNITSTLCSDHSKDAGAFCFRWVTLSQSGSLYGAVQVWKEGKGYGEVCSEKFDDTDARVVCREMGYSLAISLCCNTFNHSEFPIVMSNVQCNGNEKSIRNCQHESSNPVCSSKSYASVVCSPRTSVPPSGWPIRSLVSNLNLGYGYVQVQYFDHLGIICSEGFDDKDAEVVCRENNFVTGFAYKHNTLTRSYRHSIRWLSNVMCTGTETSLSQCGNLNWGQIGFCSHLHAAGVICVRTPGITGMEVRLTNGTTVEGRIELKLDSTWQSLCDNHLTNKEASALCRNQGFLDGVILRPGKFGNGTSYIPINSVNCIGNETKVSDCIMDVSSVHTCNTGATAIKCYTTVRLTGSDIVEYGRLEMFNGTGWDAVCDDEFDDNDANVFCKYMGYSAGKYQCCSRIGTLPSTTRIAITKVNCNGRESKPQDCKFINGSCNTGHYVSVLCISTFRGEDLSVRLPLNSFYGPVEVRRFGLWGYVCDSYWTDKEATVVCRHLGFQSGRAISTKIDDRTPIIMGNVSCFSSEAHFDHCRRTLFGADHGCFSRKTVAGVICSNKAVDGIKFGNKDSTLANILVDDKSLVIDSLDFENSDARVFCKSMGFAGGTTALFGGRQKVAIVDVSCTGNENSFLQCKAFWDPRKSKMNMPAGVTCHRDVRLTAGGTFYGIVEVYKNNTWGTVCSNGFDRTDSNIVCSELEFERGISLCCSPFGYIPSPHTVSEIQCSGSESRITDCKFKWTKDVSSATCDVPWDYSSVLCFNGALSNSYKLAIKGNSYTGELVLTYMKVPGRICADGWDDRDARVACKELNYKYGLAYNHYVEEGPRTHGPYWTSDVQCIGTEAKLGDCAMTTYATVSHCTARHYAGVLCYNDEGLYYRLTGGDERYGRIEVYLYDHWGSVCDTHWDQREAHVYCKQVSYATGDPYYGEYNSPGARQIYETQFECTGSETDLNRCPHGTWETATSERCLLRQNNAGVFCYTSVKLHSGVGRETSEGAVLFYKYNQWNLVCDDGFTDSSAKLVCKELGFVDGRATCCSTHGNLQWQLLTNQTMKCVGSEPDVATCVKIENCKSQTYASVKCYDYILPTTEATVSTTKSSYVTVVTVDATGVTTKTGRYVDITPTIVGVVVSLLVLIIIIVVVIFVFKWRRNMNAAHKHEQFHNDILEHAHDGSVRVRNPLHEIPPPPGTDELTISSTGVVSYLPSTESNMAAVSNPTYAKAEPIRTIINVSRTDSSPDTENEYATLRLSTKGQTNIYDNVANDGDVGTSENGVDTNLRNSLAETAEIHSPDYNMEQPYWPAPRPASDDEKRTEL